MRTNIPQKDSKLWCRFSLLESFLFSVLRCITIINGGQKVFSGSSVIADGTTLDGRHLLYTSSVYWINVALIFGICFIISVITALVCGVTILLQRGKINYFRCQSTAQLDCTFTDWLSHYTSSVICHLQIYHYLLTCHCFTTEMLKLCWHDLLQQMCFFIQRRKELHVEHLLNSFEGKIMKNVL